MSITGSATPIVQNFTTDMQNAAFDMGVGVLGISLGTTFLNQIATYMTTTTGATIENMYAAVLSSSVAQNSSLYPAYLTNAQFADRLGTKLLGAKGTNVAATEWQAAIDWATAQLDGGASRASVTKLAVETVQGIPSTDATYGKAAAAFDNKVAVSKYYTMTKSGSSTDLTTLTNTIAAVTNTTSVANDAALETVINAAGGSVSTTGTTFTLTTSQDNIVGTNNADTVNASLVYASAGTTVDSTSTLSAADIIAAGTGTDVMNVTITGGNAGTTFAPASITGVETLNIRNVSGQTNSLDAGTIAGLTAVNADRATSAVTLTNLASGTTAGMIGNSTATNGAFNAGWVTSSTSPATSAVLNVMDGTTAGAVTLSGANIASTTINSTGATNTIGALAMAATSTSLTINATTKLTTGAVTNTGGGNATTKVTVTGAGAVDLSTTALEGGVATVDASGNTGGVTVKVSSLVTGSFTGGSGNDVVTTNAILTTGSMNAGAGTDTLDIGTNVTHANTAALAAKYTNFETLRVSGTFDASLIGSITAIELSGATNSITSMTATQAAAVTGRADIGGTTLALATATGNSDVLSLTLGTGKGAAFDTGTLVATGFETINIKANPVAGDADTTAVIAAITDANLTTLNLTGTAVTLTDAATTKAVTIDASGLTGSAASTPVGLTITGGNTLTGSTITGSAVKDVITALGTGFATYNLGAGNDTVTATVAQLNTGANYNTINAGDGTKDALTITNGAATAVTIVDNNLSKISGFETITITDSTSGNQSIQTGGWFDAAFKTNGVSLTTTTSTGTITIDMTSFTGAATISATTVGTAAAEGVVSVQTGSGNDSITVVDAAASNAGTISSFGGNDTIVGGVNDETITGGTGTDTMTGGGTTANTFVFAAGDTGGVPSATAYDTITDFTAVAGNVINASAASIVTNATATSGVAAISAAGVATFNTVDNTFALHLVAVEAAINAGGTAAAGQSAMWQEGADAYLFISDGTDGIGANDILIKLTGLDTTAAAFDTLTDGGTTFTIA